MVKELQEGETNQSCRLFKFLTFVLYLLLGNRLFDQSYFFIK
ncbi:hypothetical protein D932_02836 [Enterococcus casseliflavus 14-MB-W-14]|nr:hypothetical protein D932_02836 [Enterococcus casseliflavus 14-MB-W-14]